VAEVRALDRIEVEARGGPAERAGELDRLGDPEAVRGRGVREHARVAAVDGARRRARRAGVDDDDVRLALPQVEQSRRIVGAHAAGRARDGRPGAVVAPPGVADADHDHPRSISRRRKCVAQEMHGS